jgi:hypothetical protein
MVHSSPSNSSSDFVEDDDDVEEEAEYLPEPVAPVASVIASVLPTASTPAVEEDEDEGEDEEEAPKPKPVIRRKTVPAKK